MERTALPPLDIVGPTGERVVMRSLVPTDTVGALAIRLGTDDLWLDSGRLDPVTRLVDVDGLRLGVRLCRADEGAASGHLAECGTGTRPGSGVGGEPIVRVAVVGGPGVTAWQTLPVGRHHLGRSIHAGLRIDDPTVESHHALVEVGADGDVEIVQLTGTVPVRVDRDEDELGMHRTIATVGSSRIDFRSLASDRSAPAGSGPTTRGSVAVHPTDPWRRVVWRAPHTSPAWSPSVISAPPPAPVEARASMTALIGTAVTAIGAVGLSVALRNAMFAVFAAVGAFGAVVTFAAAAWSARRVRRSAERARVCEVSSFEVGVLALRTARRSHHVAVNPSVACAIGVATGDGSRLWQRRVVGGAPLSVVVGSGTSRWSPPIEVDDVRALDGSLLHQIEQCGRLDGVAAPLTLEPGDAVAFHGPASPGRAVARSVIAQLATWVGPADWQLVVVSEHPTAWGWTDWLPHGALGGASWIRLVTHDVDSAEILANSLDSVDSTRRTVVVTDEPHLFAARTGPLRRFVSASGATCVIVVDTDATVPAICRRVLTIGSTGSASWSGDTPDSDDCVGITYAGVSVSTADRVARHLACLVDPEDGGGIGGGVAAQVTFADIVPDHRPETIAARWAAGGADPAPITPIGRTADGRVDIDLVRDGPHGLIAGTTGSGKSELLRSLVIGLATMVGPEHLNFVLVDYKGGSTFDACVDLPHTVGSVTDLDDGLARRALISLDAELHRRERLLRSLGAADLSDYRRRRVGCEASTPVGLPQIARLVVVIDEFAALAQELPDFLSALVGIAQRGRSLGVHLLLATQRPAGVVNDAIRANTNLRLALRLHDRADALDVVADPLPSTFPRGLPGRAVLRLGPDELVVFQAARCTGALAEDLVSAGAPRRSTELESAVAAVVAAAATAGTPSPHRPWADPLPFPLDIGDVAALGDDGDATAIGLIDDPADQCRRPLVWRPGDGGLALVGAIGSGTTSTLIAIGAAACASTTPDDLHLYVIDARGDDGLAAFASIAHCGGVVRPTEDERLHRLLVRVVTAIDRRVDGGGRPDDARIVVMIDGYGSLRTALSTLDRTDTFDLLHRVVNDGPAVGIVLVVSDDAGGAIATMSIAHRWVFHLDDPGAARSIGGVPAVPAGRPGRLRIAGSGLEAQVARGAAGLAALPCRDAGRVGRGGPSVISMLPDRIEWSMADASRCGDGLLVGIEADSLARASLDVSDGDHVLVVGGPRSGVSTALDTCAAAWSVTMASRGIVADVVRVDRRRPLAPEVVASLAVSPNRVLLVIDDAHRVDDPGIFASIARGEHPHLTIFAAGRADGVRTAYGHWTREVATSRYGLVMSSRGDPDGDVLGVTIPRRSLVSARPGLAWLVDGGRLRQAQIAVTR